MNRPIKFRAWNKEDRRMIDLHKITPLALAIDPSIVGAGIGVYVPDDKRLVLMQFTSLHDPNGKEIWEGDIVRFTRKHGYWSHNRGDVESVKYIDDQQAQFCGFGFSPLLPLTRAKAKKVEVIGNIFEHPELLEGK